MGVAVTPAVRHRLIHGALVLFALGAGGSTWAQGSPTSRSVSPEAIERSETQWLQAIQSAAERLNYVGTIVYQRGGAMHSSHVVHYFDGTISHERLQLLDGKRREYVRRDTEVQCLYPDSRRVRIEQRPSQDAFPAIGSGASAEILDYYRLSIGGIERVAGIDCRVIVLEPRDSLRYGHWLCAERRTALLLKARTFNEQQEPLEQMAFADLKISERIDLGQLKPSWSTEGWTVEKAEMQPANVERSGWQISAPAGFRRLRAVSRRMPRGDAEKTAMQVVYSDGLATLSVFIETGVGPPLPHDFARTLGPISAYTRRLDDARVTVIGEVPPATVRDVALSVTQRGAQPATQPGAVPTEPALPR